ncbi:MAG: PqqD family peptide modification chaperone [Gammaproteobacteria bacterium]|nr:PqqD family peptide modification chaperone [Gammaproteobacteria bacterium]
MQRSAVSGGGAAATAPLPAELAAFDCGSQVLLYAQRTNDLYLLNETASFIWRSLEQGRSLDALIGALRHGEGAGSADVERDVRELLEQWRQLASRPPPDPITAAPALVREPVVESRRSRRLACTAHYRLLDFRFTLSSNDPAVADVAAGLLGHLETGEEAPAVIDVVRDGGRWQLWVDERFVDSCGSAAEIAPMLHANVLMTAYARTTCLAAIHAAAVLRDGACVLLPAVSGSGKSTLTGALLAAGMGYCTDDLAVLVGTPVRVRPAPVAIGLKQGAWPVLEDKLPGLRSAPTHVRSDGRKIRYLTVPGTPADRTYPVRALIFPSYRSGAETSWRRIGVAEAFMELTRAGYDARLSVELIRVLLDWLAGVPSYRLRYGDIDSGVGAVCDILAVGAARPAGGRS